MGNLIPNVIASRELQELDSHNDKTIIVQIGKPRKVSNTEWECAFHITNIGMNEVQFGHGIDSVQALIQAIEGSRVFLEKSGKELSWEGGEKGNTGIPRYVPTFYGKDFSDRLHTLIDSEIEGFAQSAERQHEQTED